MNIYTALKRQARAKRDKALQTVHDHYRETLRQIKKIQRADEKRCNGAGYRDRQINRGRPGTPFNRLGLAAAAERLLLEGKPLRMQELILELQQRGYRPNKDRRMFTMELNSAFTYHATRFVQDDSGKWQVV